MKGKAVVKDEEHEDALCQGKSLNEPLDNLPKRFLPAKVDRCHRVADHDVAEENNPHRNEAVEAEEEACQETEKTAEESPDRFAAMEWVNGGINGQDEGKAEDLDDAVAHDHLVHPILLLLLDDCHRPYVEWDGEEKHGKSNPKAEATMNLRITINEFCIFKKRNILFQALD